MNRYPITPGPGATLLPAVPPGGPIFGAVPGATAEHGWQMMAKTVRDVDEDKVRDAKEDIDTLLVFAGLYSAVLSAFLIDSYKNLQLDSGDEIVFLLRQSISQNYTISGTFLNSTTPYPSQYPFEVPLWAIRVNGLWFASLVCSLATASIGMLVKQWLREFLAVGWISPRERLRARQYRAPALDTWLIQEIAAFLPILLQISLALFFVGLCFFTAAINEQINLSTLPLVCAWAFFVVITTLAPLLSPRCPFKTPLLKYLTRTLRTRIFNRLRERLHIPPSEEEGEFIVRKQGDLDVLLSVDEVMGSDDGLLYSMWTVIQESTFSPEDAIRFVHTMVDRRVGQVAAEEKAMCPQTPDDDIELQALSSTAQGMLNDVLSLTLRRYRRTMEPHQDGWASDAVRMLVSAFSGPISPRNEISVTIMHDTALLKILDTIPLANCSPPGVIGFIANVIKARALAAMSAPGATHYASPFLPGDVLRFQNLPDAVGKAIIEVVCQLIRQHSTTLDQDYSLNWVENAIRLLQTNQGFVDGVHGMETSLRTVIADDSTFARLLSASIAISRSSLLPAETIRSIVGVVRLRRLPILYDATHVLLNTTWTALNTNVPSAEMRLIRTAVLDTLRGLGDSIDLHPLEVRVDAAMLMLSTTDSPLESDELSILRRLLLDPVFTARPRGGGPGFAAYNTATWVARAIMPMSSTDYFPIAQTLLAMTLCDKDSLDSPLMSVLAIYATLLREHWQQGLNMLPDSPRPSSDWPLWVTVHHALNARPDAEEDELGRTQAILDDLWNFLWGFVTEYTRSDRGDVLSANLEDPLADIGMTLLVWALGDESKGEQVIALWSQMLPGFLQSTNSVSMIASRQYSACVLNASTFESCIAVPQKQAAAETKFPLDVLVDAFVKYDVDPDTEPCAMLLQRWIETTVSETVSSERNSMDVVQLCWFILRVYNSISRDHVPPGGGVHPESSSLDSPAVSPLASTQHWKQVWTTLAEHIGEHTTRLDTTLDDPHTSYRLDSKSWHWPPPPKPRPRSLESPYDSNALPPFVYSPDNNYSPGSGPRAVSPNWPFIPPPRVHFESPTLDSSPELSLPRTRRMPQHYSDSAPASAQLVPGMQESTAVVATKCLDLMNSIAPADQSSIFPDGLRSALSRYYTSEEEKRSSSGSAGSGSASGEQDHFADCTSGDLVLDESEEERGLGFAGSSGWHGASDRQPGSSGAGRWPPWAAGASETEAWVWQPAGAAGGHGQASQAG